MTFLMSGPLVDKQQKTVENVENIKNRLDNQLIFMFSRCSPIFCCLSARGLDASSRFSSFLGLINRFLYIFGNPGLLCAGLRGGAVRRSLDLV